MLGGRYAFFIVMPSIILTSVIVIILKSNNAECRYAGIFIVMPSVIFPSVNTLNVIMLSVVLHNVVMLGVVAPDPGTIRAFFPALSGRVRA
jgi:hypothetical protein